MHETGHDGHRLRGRSSRTRRRRRCARRRPRSGRRRRSRRCRAPTRPCRAGCSVGWSRSRVGRGMGQARRRRRRRRMRTTRWVRARRRRCRCPRRQVRRIRSCCRADSGSRPLRIGSHSTNQFRCSDIRLFWHQENEKKTTGRPQERGAGERGER